MKNFIYNKNCLEIMKTLPNKSIDFVLTDIPYGEVTRESNFNGKYGNFDSLGTADIVTFNLKEFLDEVYRISNGSICIFCGRGQFSEIFNYFENKKGTVRPIVWEKTNPVPLNGQYVYLSGVEFAVWFKKSGTKTFYANCKNTVFKYPIPGGKKRVHKTQKHIDLIKELIEDNTKEGDLIFDPCSGSGVVGVAAQQLNRNFILCELDTETYNIQKKFLKDNNITFEEKE